MMYTAMNIYIVKNPFGFIGKECKLEIKPNYVVYLYVDGVGEVEIEATYEDHGDFIVQEDEEGVFVERWSEPEFDIEVPDHLTLKPSEEDYIQKELEKMYWGYIDEQSF